MLKRTVLSALLIGTLSLGLAACEEKDDQKAGAAKQKEVMARAINAVPAYVPSEYTAREDINWSLQETEGRHVWYVYALSMDGLPLFYVVSDVLPRAKCVSITPPDRKVKGSSGNVVMSSPALDGTYYGGGGNCDVYYLRDAQTGGYIQLTSRSMTIIAAKVPLSIETDRLRLEPPDASTSGDG